MIYQARNVMNVNVVAIRPDTSVEEAIRTLVEHSVSGAPVVDNRGEMVGVISEFALLEAIYTPDVRQSPVSQFMSKDVLTVTENGLLSDIANLFVLHRIRRIPVVREKRVIGIISRRDLLRYILNHENDLEKFFEELQLGVGA